MADIEKIVAFLTACHDEDESIANTATAGPWRWDREEYDGEPTLDPYGWGDHGPNLETVREEWADWAHAKIPLSVVTSYGHDANGIIVKRGDADHIARHDPTDVLLRLDAERAIVTTYRERQGEYLRDLTDGEVDGLRIAVQGLAFGYRGRDGFDPTWFDHPWGPP